LVPNVQKTWFDNTLRWNDELDGCKSVL